MITLHQTLCCVGDIKMIRIVPTLEAYYLLDRAECQK